MPIPQILSLIRKDPSRPSSVAIWKESAGVLRMTSLLSPQYFINETSATVFRVEATNITTLNYTPTLDISSVWSVEPSGDSEFMVSTRSLATISFNVRGFQLVSLLANPNNFSADMLLLVDSGPAQVISFANMNKTVDANGLFTIFTILILQNSEILAQNLTHSILMQENPSDGDATWNLVAIELTPFPNSTQASVFSTAPTTIAVTSTAAETQNATPSTQTTSIPLHKSGLNKMTGAIVGAGAGLVVLLSVILLVRLLWRRKTMTGTRSRLGRAQIDYNRGAFTRIFRKVTQSNIGLFSTSRPRTRTSWILGSVHPLSFFSSEVMENHGRKSKRNLLIQAEQASRLTARTAMKEQSRRIELRIREAQESVAILRSQSLTSSIIPQPSEDGTIGLGAGTFHKVDAGNLDTVDSLRIRIAAQEAELESLRLERMQMQQVIDAMENETLPEYEEAYVNEILSMRSRQSTSGTSPTVYNKSRIRFFRDASIRYSA